VAQPVAQVFTVIGPDGDEFGQDTDRALCEDTAAELGVGARVVDSQGETVFTVQPKPQVEPEPEPRKETMAEKLARLKAEKAVQVKPEVESAPASVIPVVNPLRIVHNAEDGTVLYGTAKGDGANDIVKPHGWRYHFRKDEKVGIWYIVASKGFRSQDDKIEATVAALKAAGFSVDVEIDNEDPFTGNGLPVKLTAAQREQLRAQEKARRVEAARQAKEAAEAARKAAEAEVQLRGLEVFAAVVSGATAQVPVVAEPRKATRSRKATRKPSLELEGLASVPGAMWWRMAVKDGISPKDTATAVRRALKTVVDAHATGDEEDLKIEVRLHKGSRTLLIAAVLPERESGSVDADLVDVQCPAAASLFAQGVGAIVERHSDFS
jgi:hypothetical protein